MNLKNLLFIFFALFVFTEAAAQIQYRYVVSNGKQDTPTDPSDNFVANNDCITSGIAGNADIHQFDVSGAPILDEFYISIAITYGVVTGALDMQLLLRSPQGTVIELAQFNPNTFPPDYNIGGNIQYYFELNPGNCPSLGNFIGQADFSAFDGEDPNGTWRVAFCGSSACTFSFDRFVMLIDYKKAWPSNFDITNTSNCSSEDGEISFRIRGGIPPNNNGDYYKIDNGTWEDAPPGDCDDPAFYTVSGLSAGVHTLSIASKHPNGAIDENNITITPINIESNGGSGELFINCVQDETVPLGVMELVPPTSYGHTCGEQVSKLVYRVINPSGAMIKAGFYDFLEGEEINFDLQGNYEVIWTVNSTTSGDEKECTQNITVDISTSTTVTAPICNGSDPFAIQRCFSGTDDTRIPIDIAGLPSRLSPEFALRGVRLSANIPSVFSTGSQPYFDLYDPDGNRYRLANPASFPGYDPNVHAFNAYISTCASAGIPGADETGIPFVENGTYNAMVDFYLNRANIKDINPNGTWYLSVCRAEAISVNCFELDFGNNCAYLEQSDIKFGGVCESYVELNLNDIDAPFCNDYDEDGIPDFFVSIDGIPYFWGSDDILRIPTSPGGHTLEFGIWMRTENIDEYIPVCSQTFNINVPSPTDSQAPMVSSCPDNVTVSVNQGMATTFSVVHPSGTDNCAVASATYNLNYQNGATAQGGQTSFTNQTINQGSSVDYTIVGEGSAVFDWKFTDAAGNNQTCQTIITSESSGPCGNDMEAPQFTGGLFGGCQSDQLLILDANGEATWNYTDPGFIDNCTSEANIINIQTIFYRGGCTAFDGSTQFGPWGIEPNATYSYDVRGTGFIEIVNEIIDQAGNSTFCTTFLIVTDLTGPCANDATVPTISNCPQNTTVSLDATGKATFTVRAPNRDDNCGIESTSVVVRFEGGATDELGRTIRNFTSFKSGTPATFTVVGPGTITYEFTATDYAGNSNSCTTVVASQLSTNDLFFSVGSDCVKPDGSVNVPVTVNNFDQIGGFQFDLEIVGNGLSFGGIANSTLSNVNYNILSNGDMRVIWVEVNGNDIDLNDGTRVFDIMVNADASFAAAANIIAKDFVIFTGGGDNDDAIANIGVVCLQLGVTPLGAIEDEKGTPHSGVPVRLYSGANLEASTTTSSQGLYSFGATEDTNILRPEKNDEIRQGINVADVALIRRHVLQIANLDTDYKIVAGDVNKDGRINVADVGLSRRVVLELADEFPNNTSWRFLPKYLDISADPLDVNHPEQIVLDAANLDYDNLDFVSVKVGDVNQSALSIVGSDPTEKLLALTLSIPDTTLMPSNDIRIPVYVTGGDNITAAQFKISYDPTHMNLTNIESDLMASCCGGLYNDNAGEVIFAWDHPQGGDFMGEGKLLTLVFEAVASTGMSNISISDIEMFDPDFNNVNASSNNGSVNFRMTSVGDINVDYEISARPNPFRDEVNFSIRLEEPQEVTITLTDITGRIIKEVRSGRSSQHILNIDNLDYQGAILAIIKGEGFRETVRLLKL